MFQKTITFGFLKALQALRYGQMSVVTPDGKRHDFIGKEPGEKATMILHDWNVIPNLVKKGDIGLADDYRKGLWDADDLAAFMTLGLRNEDALDDYLYGLPFSQTIARLARFFKRNTLTGSKKNIEAHYDLGNEFYKLWLDPSMTYSAALFHDKEQALQDAQGNKYERIVERLLPSGRLLEIGCGWGGFAEHAMQRKDYAIKGLTLSSEQKRFADERLKGKADIALQDYRNEQGQYDNIVSIEMFEAVGEEYWTDYFVKISNALKAQGRAMIQTITIDEKYFERYRQGSDFIRKYIFPGGMLPTAMLFMEHAKKAGLQITDQFRFGQDYGLTLQRWLTRFDAQVDAVRKLGFDDAFIRIWRLYLAGCIGSFRVGRTDVMQAELRHI